MSSPCLTRISGPAFMFLPDDLRKEMESYLGFLADHELEDLYEGEPLNRTLAENKTHFPRAAAALVQIPVTASPPGHTVNALKPQSLANLDLATLVHEAKQRAAAARSLDELYAELDAFQHMPMRHEGARQMVRYRGADTPDLLVIGEIPDLEEDLSGRAFAGKPGALIDTALSAAGVSGKTMLTPCVFWRTAGGRPLTQEDLSMNGPFLQAFMRLAAPKAILLLGASAVISALNLDQSLAKLRGRVISHAVGDINLPVVASFAPAFVMRQPACKAMLWRDLLQLLAKAGL